MSDKPDFEKENAALFRAELACLEREPATGKVILAGRSWSQFGALGSDPGYLTSHGDGVAGIEVRPAWNKPGFRWSWYCKLFHGVYLRYNGDGDSVEAAALAALAVQPEFYDFEYLGTTWRWWAQGDKKWIAVVQGEQAEVVAYEPRQGEPAFGWLMPLKAAAAVLGMAGCSRGITGEATSKEEAFRACVDAPDRFIRACGALASKFSELRSVQPADRISQLQNCAEGSPHVE